MLRHFISSPCNVSALEIVFSPLSLSILYASINASRMTRQLQTVTNEFLSLLTQRFGVISIFFDFNLADKKEIAVFQFG